MNARNGRIALTGFLVLSIAGVLAFPLTAGAQSGAKTTAASVPTVIESIVVDANDADGTWSSDRLTQGLVYELQVAGTFTYGQGDSRADAECSQLLPDETWQPNRYAAMSNYRDILDLYLDNDPVDWQGTESDALGCNSFNHTYVYKFTMPETRHIRLFVRDLDGSYQENSGGLNVRLRQLDAQAASPVAPVAAPTESPATPPAAPAASPVAGPTRPAAPAPASDGAPATTLPASAETGPASQLAIGEDVLTAGPAWGALPPPSSPRDELLQVLALVAWLAAVGLILRRFQFVVVPAGARVEVRSD